MARESTQHKLDRVRPPRVQITYDVEIGDAIEMKELPFVVGVLADLSGKPEEPLPRLKDRKFVEIDRDNFDEVLRGMKPRLAFRVDNKLSDDDTPDGRRAEVQLARRLRARAGRPAGRAAPQAAGDAAAAVRRCWPRWTATTSSTDMLQEIMSNTDMLKKTRQRGRARARQGKEGRGNELTRRSGAKSQSAEAASQEASLLDQIIGRPARRNDEQREESRRQISTLVEEVMQGHDDLEGYSRPRSMRASRRSISS